MPDVGIVMPVYTQKKNLLRAAIRSISRQSYRNYRFVIVIDGITPEVLRVARQESKRNKRIRIVAYRENRGTQHALNVGFQVLARDPRIKYWTWVASDNLYYRNFIRILRNRLMSGPEHLGLVFSNMNLIRANGSPIHDTRRWQEVPLEKLLDYNFILGSFLYKREIGLKTGNYEHTPVEDYDYWLRLTEHCSIQYIPRALVSYRMFAPKSNSLKIRNNPRLYRDNRYKFELVKHLARMRRNIPPELTVVLPVTDGSDSTIAKLEGILEQTYSNFFLLVIDLSPEASASHVLSQIPDPRMHIVPAEVSVEHDYLQFASRYITTRFFHLFNNQERIGKQYLEHLIVNAGSPDWQGGNPIIL